MAWSALELFHDAFPLPNLGSSLTGPIPFSDMPNLFISLSPYKLFFFSQTFFPLLIYLHIYSYLNNVPIIMLNECFLGSREMKKRDLAVK